MFESTLTRLLMGQERLDRMQEEMEHAARLIMDFVKMNPSRINWKLKANSMFDYKYGDGHTTWNITWFSHPGAEVVFQLYCKTVLFQDEARFTVSSSKPNSVRISHVQLRSVKTVRQGFDNFVSQFTKDHPDFGETIKHFLKA